MSVKLLVEEFPDDRARDVTCLEDHLCEWTNEFISKDYEELRDAIDGIIFTVDTTKISVLHINKLLPIYDRIRSSLPEGSFSVLATRGNGDHWEHYEDECLAYGLECVNMDDSGKISQYNEKQGVERVVEILQTHEWSHMDGGTVDGDDYLTHKEEKMGHMTAPLLGQFEKDKMPIDELHRRLEAERIKVRGMADHEREDYVKGIVDDLIDYI